LDGDEKMKKLNVILATPVILAFTMVCIISTPAQDKNAKIYMDNTDQSWPSTSTNLSRKGLYWGMNPIPYLAQIPIVVND
jgi:hypothetical protein